MVKKLIPEQKIASDPNSNIWFAASAGSGKTFVLTARFISLLLQGARPEHILAITFTKNSANEMIARISQQLAQFTALDDDNLTQEIAQLIPDFEKLNHDEVIEKISLARRLFAKIHDTQGGLKIMTIHSFCQSLLSQFPIESGLAMNFNIIDEEENLQLWQVAIETALEMPEITAILANLRHKIQDDAKLSEAVKKLWSERYKYQKIAQKPAIKSELLAYLGLNPQWQDSDYLHSLNQDNRDGLDLKDYLQIYLTQKYQPRARNPDNAKAEILAKTYESYRIYQLAMDSYNIFQLTMKIGEIFQTTKLAHNKLDFDDLIIRCAQILETDIHPWVQYKTDGGIRHILLDEAQDTNPDQWRVVRAIIDNFPITADEYHKKTLFIVGDVKQSIYSFQRADVHEFQKQKLQITEILHHYNRLQEVHFNQSFRSAPIILRFVDAVFQPKSHGEALGIDNILHHNASDKTAKDQGNITIYEVIRHDNDNKMQKYHELGDKIVSLIASLVGKVYLPQLARYCEYRDIMILLQKRPKFQKFLVKKLKSQGIMVNGADRFSLITDFITLDLLCLADFCLLPSDDLALANLLKSPFIGLNDDDLYQISAKRQKRLWDNLQEFSQYQTIINWLNQRIAQAKQHNAYEFFCLALNSFHPMAKQEKPKIIRCINEFSRRLGAESQETIDFILDKILQIGQKSAFGLAEIAFEIRKNQAEIKREMNNKQLNEVRLLTVHGAKGLEAPIVILPEMFAQIQKDSMVWLDDDLPAIYMPPKDWQLPPKAQAKLEKYRTTIANEKFRLLYVALTRAKSHLYIFGLAKEQKESEANSQEWYDLCHNAMLTLPAIYDESQKKYEFSDFNPIIPADIPEATTKNYQYPNFIHHNRYFSDENPKNIIKPSDFDIDATDNWHDREKAQKLGVIYHRLLQILPNIPPENRLEWCKNYGLRKSIIIPEQAIQAIMRIISEFPEFFGRNSQAEVIIKGELNGQIISGQMDRLIIGDGIVSIIDFKSQYEVPKSYSEIPPYYIQQCQLYRQLCQKIYPNHEIKAYLLYFMASKLWEIL